MPQSNGGGGGGSGGGGGGGGNGGVIPPDVWKVAFGRTLSPMEEAPFFQNPLVKYASMPFNGSLVQLTGYNSHRIALILGVAGTPATPATVAISPDQTLVRAASVPAQNGFMLQSGNSPFFITQAVVGVLCQAAWFGVNMSTTVACQITVCEILLLDWPTWRGRG